MYIYTRLNKVLDWIESSQNASDKEGFPADIDLYWKTSRIYWSWSLGSLKLKPYKFFLSHISSRGEFKYDKNVRASVVSLTVGTFDVLKRELYLVIIMLRASLTAALCSVS